ncbi:MAG: hypothetical protein Q7J32_03135 [Sphingomonadaceae bacterium]|nr:hypothetical protein [Sphingomonadaceae bacterium]
MKLAAVSAAFLLATPALAADEAPIAVSRSLAVPLAAGGTVTVDETWGDLDIVAWDKAQVSVDFRASSQKAYPADESAKARAKLERFGVEAKAVSADAVTVTGINPGATLGSPFGGKSGVQMRYTLHVPRDSRLVVRHGVGNVGVKDVAGDVDVQGGTGELTLDLPLGPTTSVEASTRIGDIQVPPAMSEGGTHKRRALVGARFSYVPETVERRVIARLSIGSIDIE